MLAHPIFKSWIYSNYVFFLFLQMYITFVLYIFVRHFISRKLLFRVLLRNKIIIKTPGGQIPAIAVSSAVIHFSPIRFILTTTVVTPKVFSNHLKNNFFLNIYTLNRINIYNSF